MSSRRSPTSAEFFACPYASACTDQRDRRGRQRDLARDSDQILLSLTQVLGSRAVNDFKTGYVGIRNRESSRVPWQNHPAARTDGITNGSPIVTLNGFRFGPPGSVPQEIQEGKLSFRNDFTLSVNKVGRHDLKIGGSTSGTPGG